MIRKIAFLLLMIVGCFAVSHSEPTTPGYTDSFQKYLRMASPDLIKQGYDFFYHHNHPDSALLCFTIAAERLKDQMTPQEQRDVFESYCGRLEVNMLRYNNYEAGVVDLQKINELASKWKIKSARLSFCRAISAVAEYNIDPEGKDFNEVYSLLLYSFNEAIKLNNKELAIRSLNNILRAHFSGNVELPKKELDTLISKYGEKDKEIQIQKLLYLALEASNQGKTEESIKRFEEIIKLYESMELDMRNGRDYSTIVYLKAAAHIYVRQFDMAAKEWVKTIGLTYRFDQKDLRQYTLEELAVCYKALGDSDKLEETTHHAVLLKDSLWNTRITQGLEQIKFQEERENIRAQIAVVEYRSKVLRWAVFASIIIILLLAGGTMLLWRTVRKLHEKNKVIYDSVNRELTAPEVKPAEDQADSSTQPRRNKAIPDEQRDQLLARIKEVVADSQEIYSSEFSLARLATLCQTNTKYVSYVINEMFGCNFQTYINTLRVKEACRRMDNESMYEYYSTEGIAESVGFNSRSAFITAFKRTIGMSPAEYRHISQERKKKKS